MVDRVMPGIQIPVQYLGSETEIAWNSEKEARPILDALVSRFTAAPEVDSAVLLQGGHNYEFSKNVSLLWDKRRAFVEKLVCVRGTSDRWYRVLISRLDKQECRLAYFQKIWDSCSR